jgi:hypothetical protein
MTALPIRYAEGSKGMLPLRYQRNNDNIGI